MQRCTNYFVYAMPMGRLSIAADEAGICAIAFGDVAHDLDAYLAGHTVYSECSAPSAREQIGRASCRERV